MGVRKQVKCTVCNKEVERVTWNYKTKKEITTFFCGHKCKGLWQKQKREKLGYTKEWLIEEYVNKRRSANDIAREVKRDPKRVWEWIKDYGIELRPRGTDYGQIMHKGMTSYFKGHKHTEENKEKQRQRRLEDGHKPCYVNGVHWLHAYNRHPASWKGGVTPERQAFYSSLEWKDSIKNVWERDKAICQRCGKNHNDGNRGTFHIHHIVSFMVKEKRSELDNLILLCKECHLWVHSKKNENKDYIKEK